jgi:dTDP-4-dehydrorhamnose 3,5-epimerase
VSRFVTVATPLAGVVCIERQRLADERGAFSRLFCAQELASAGWTKPIAQINHTHTAQCGTVRGMHFQRPPHAEMKWVSCLRGEVWDVAVDLRVGSPTYLQWHGERLSAANHRSLLIPEGFAHGFQTLTDDVEMLYCHSMPYAAEADAGLNPLDPRLGLAWPLPVSVISDKDRHRAGIDDSRFEGVIL